MSHKYVSCSDNNSVGFHGRYIDRNSRKMSYLEWSSHIYSAPPRDDLDVTFLPLKAETDGNYEGNNPSRMAIKQESKAEFVREDFFKAWCLYGLIRRFTIFLN